MKVPDIAALIRATIAWVAPRGLHIIACDKREAFAQGSDSDEAIHPFLAAGWIASLAMTAAAVVP
jgi:hypothetical protein